MATLILATLVAEVICLALALAGDKHYVAAARDITDLLEDGAVLNEFLFAMLAERLADLCKEDKRTFRLNGT